MAYATNEERKALKNSVIAFDACAFAVRVRHNNRENEIVADDVDHALNIQKDWIDRGAVYVEIFRVFDDGSLNPTIGGYRAANVMVGDEEQTRIDNLHATL